MPAPSARRALHPARLRVRWARTTALLFFGLLPAFASGTVRADPPELAWLLSPGSGDTIEADTLAAPIGPLEGASANDVPGADGSGSATVDYGSLGLDTNLQTDFSLQEVFFLCFPGHCTTALARWSDRLVFRAPEHVEDGTAGSLTAELEIDAVLMANRSEAWSAPVLSRLNVSVQSDGGNLEEIVVLCVASSVESDPCALSVTQTLFGGSTGIVIKNPPAAGMGTFELGPYDFVYGEPLEIEIRVVAETAANLNASTEGIASAGVDANGGITWTAVVELFDDAGGAGNSLPLADAVASAASHIDWLKTVPLPEPGAGPTGAIVVLALLPLVRRTPRLRHR